MKKSNEDNTATWMAMGVGLGVSLGVVFDNIAIGVAIGAAMGLSIGSALDSMAKAKKNSKGCGQRMKKLITCLDVKDGQLTKGIKFLDNVNLGDPVAAAKKYCEDGIDEVVLYDFSATVEGRQTAFDLASAVAKVVDKPFGIGGGIKSIDDCRAAFAAGADKVHINSAAVKNPQLLAEAVKEFGKGKIVLSMDVLAVGSGVSDAPFEFEVVINGGREKTGIDAVEWAKQGESYGVCEIVVNSIDADGMKTGFHIPSTRAIAQAVKIPVVASGGGGTVQHIYDVLTEGCAEVALVASMLHYGEFTAGQIKKELAEMGIDI